MNVSLVLPILHSINMVIVFVIHIGLVMHVMYMKNDVILDVKSAMVH